MRTRTVGAHRISSLAATGLVATIGAAFATTAAAALAKAAGVDFEIPAGGEAIPLGGFATVTGLLSLVGVALAITLARWSARPAEWFVRTTVTLTAISLAPPFLSGADVATTVVLVGLHLLAAAVVIPTVARSLAGTGAREG